MPAGAEVRPDVSVVVASHDRALRLRWLLTALGEQTLPRDRFEVVVAHDSRGAATAELLRAHPLEPVVLAFPPGSAGPAAKRNAGWRRARAPLVAFTDDDCRPAPDWLERLLAAAAADPRAIVQGRTEVDPDEWLVKTHARWARSQEAHPPTFYGQTCNIAYPRALLEATGGFDEALPVAAGEDTDLLLRARARGAGLLPARDAVVFHAVDDGGLLGQVRGTWRWQHLAAVVRRHPRVRRRLPLGLLWKARHGWLLLAVAAALGTLRRPALLVLAVPYVADCTLVHGRGPRALARTALALPGHLLIDGTEVLAALRGAWRYRTIFL